MFAVIYGSGIVLIFLYDVLESLRHHRTGEDEDGPALSNAERFVMRFLWPLVPFIAIYRRLTNRFFSLAEVRVTVGGREHNLPSIHWQYRLAVRQNREGRYKEALFGLSVLIGALVLGASYVAGRLSWVLLTSLSDFVWASTSASVLSWAALIVMFFGGSIAFGVCCWMIEADGITKSIEGITE